MSAVITGMASHTITAVYAMRRPCRLQWVRPSSGIDSPVIRSPEVRAPGYLGEAYRPKARCRPRFCSVLAELLHPLIGRVTLSGVQVWQTACATITP